MKKDAFSALPREKYSYTTPFVFAQNDFVDYELIISKCLIIIVFIIIFIYFVFDCIRSYICHLRANLVQSLSEMSSDEPELMFD